MWPIVDQFPIKAGWRDTPFVLRDFSQGNKQSLIGHYENIDLSSWKFKPFNMKISTFQHENLDSSSWKSRQFIMKISTVYHENLDRSLWKSDRSSWKSPPFVIKSWLFATKSGPFVMRINLNFFPKWRSTRGIKISPRWASPPSRASSPHMNSP